VTFSLPQLHCACRELMLALLARVSARRKSASTEVLCYRGGIMSKRAGTTRKISVSLRSSDLESLRKRAKRLYGGNISAVIAELAADAELLEGMQQLVTRLGGPTLSDDDRRSLDRDWTAPSPASPKRRSKRARKGA
jgi:hypothetical protein